ncbi:phosphotransferase [Actinomyces radicidentis]|uniref:Phosphotransferase n=1 Tax=Actinomyces radicidentis TaxID=111015 RepID=A0A0X8JEJ5_ACTRD|nr:phosphotransferase [Actinomyces radicidentis]AMD87385.1 phosphotransferase [Actinomyces radicidentis]
MSNAQARLEPEEVALLTGPRAASVLSAALAPTGQQLVSWEVHSVHHRPGAGVSVGYTAVVAAPGRRQVTEYLCATTARLSNPNAPGLTRVAPTGGDGPVVHVWRHPADPELPALAVACTPSMLSRRLGVAVKATMVAYRPTRRAVVRVTYPDSSTAYAKVLRPDHSSAFAERHRMLRAAGVPAPAVLRDDPDGLVLLSTGAGVPLSGLLSRGMDRDQATRVFASLTGLLDALPASALQLSAHPAWSERARHYAHAAATVLPEHAARARAVADGVEQLMAATDAGPLVPVHGDFYEANVLMEGEGVASLLDVDSLGPGRRVDDLACLLGHVSVLDHLAPASYPHVRPVLERWTELAERQVDPVALRARCAGVVLSLVAGARREDGGPWRPDAEGRLARAESWLAQAREIQARRGAH